MAPNATTLRSAPGFKPAFNATVVHGGDWIHLDPDGRYVQQDSRAAATTDDGVVSVYFLGS